MGNGVDRGNRRRGAGREANAEAEALRRRQGSSTENSGRCPLGRQQQHLVVRSKNNEQGTQRALWLWVPRDGFLFSEGKIYRKTEGFKSGRVEASQFCHEKMLGGRSLRAAASAAWRSASSTSRQTFGTASAIGLGLAGAGAFAFASETHLEQAKQFASPLPTEEEWNAQYHAPLGRLHRQTTIAEGDESVIDATVILPAGPVSPAIQPRIWDVVVVPPPMQKTLATFASAGNGLPPRS